MLREYVKLLKISEAMKFAFIILIIILTDIAILLDIPVLRVIFGFLCYTILPGMLILFILKLNKIGATEKIVLSVGLSISFLMFFGFLIDKLYFGLGYATPLSTISLVVSFSAGMIILGIISYKRNKEAFSFAIPNFNLNAGEKAFLIFPIFFPALSIFGIYVMNVTYNNIILIFLLFLIPIYVAFVSFFNQKFPKRLYPVVIFLISISLLLLWSLRSNHILGCDTHGEYECFQTVFSSLHWSIFADSLLNACLSVTLLPSIYQSLLKVNTEYLFKILYSLLYSVAPLVVFIISRKYVEELYAFLASFFFMSQKIFIWAAANSRTVLAVLFFALAIMVLFHNGIDTLKKRMLFITFIASCIVSHYSTTYIFFFIILMSWLLMEIFAKKYTFKKIISLTLVLLFFGVIFFWYSQLTTVAFTYGVDFFEQTLTNLNRFFVVESRKDMVRAVVGEDIMYKGIPHKMEFVATWATFILIGTGVLTMIIKRKKMVAFSNFNGLKSEFLKTKIDVGYFTMALVCSGVLVIAVAIPEVLAHYDANRFYILPAIVLSTVLIIGGITISKYLKLRPYLLIILVLISYFVCCSSTALIYQAFDVPRSIILNCEGTDYHKMYIHDQESYAGEWLGNYVKESNQRLYTDTGGRIRLLDCKIKLKHDSLSRSIHGKINGYIYLRHYNVKNEKLLGESGMAYNLAEYSDTFVGNSRIYDNGGSEVWK